MSKALEAMRRYFETRPLAVAVLTWTTSVAMVIVLLVVFAGCVTTQRADGSSETALLGIPVTSTDADGNSRPVWLDYLIGGGALPLLGSVLSRRVRQNVGRTMSGTAQLVAGAVTLNKERVMTGSKMAARGLAASYGFAHTNPEQPS